MEGEKERDTLGYLYLLHLIPSPESFLIPLMEEEIGGDQSFLRDTL